VNTLIEISFETQLANLGKLNKQEDMSSVRLETVLC
jgi:hypothetical protein